MAKVMKKFIQSASSEELPIVVVVVVTVVSL